MQNEKRNVSDLVGAFSAMVFVIVQCLAFTGNAAATALTIQKSFVTLIDTGLEDGDPHISQREAGIWIDDHRLLARISAQDELSGPRVRYRGRTVLYDLVSRKTTEIMKYASPICWDSVTAKGALAVNDDPYDTSNKKQTVVGIKVDVAGTVTEQVVGLRGGKRGIDCDVRRPSQGSERRQWQLRPEHGVLDAGRRGREPLDTGKDAYAVLIKPGRATVELPVLGRRVDEARYLPFLKQYQLEWGSGCLRAGEPCPPDIHMMDSAGAITTLKIPEELLQWISVTSVYVVRDGLLFPSLKAGKREGYFLLRGNVLYHLWEPGSGGLFSSKRTELWGGETISPDGCKVAFSQGHRPSRIYVFDHCAVGK